LQPPATRRPDTVHTPHTSITMAKSARSSAIKKNNAVLKKRVFGPVETARNDRMSAKLLELAKAPKEKMEIVEDSELAPGKAWDGKEFETDGSPGAEKDAAKEKKSATEGSFSKFISIIPSPVETCTSFSLRRMNRLQVT
jgi:hypothetical protein